MFSFLNEILEEVIAAEKIRDKKAYETAIEKLVNITRSPLSLKEDTDPHPSLGDLTDRITHHTNPITIPKFKDLEAAKEYIQTHIEHLRASELDCIFWYEQYNRLKKALLVGFSDLESIVLLTSDDEILRELGKHKEEL